MEQQEKVKRGDLSNQWQPATTCYRPETDEDGFGANSYGQLEAWSRQCYHHSLIRRKHLQGEMWREIQNALKTERISGSAGRSVCTEPSQRPSVHISENRFNLLPSHQPPSYTSVKYDTSGRMLNEQGESKVLRSSWSQPPDYTPPPPYTSQLNWNKPMGMLEPDGSFPNLSKEYRFGSGPHNERQIEQSSVLFSDRRPGTMPFPGPDRTQPQKEFWPSGQQQIKNQQQVFTSQSSGHHEKYQMSYSDITLPKPKRRRRSGGTVFCLVSHMGELGGLCSSPHDLPLKRQTFPLLKSSTFTETQEQVQLADVADSCQSLTLFNLDPTPEETREERQNQSDQNVRLSNPLEELRKNREELRKQTNEKRCFMDLSKNKHEDSKNTDSSKDNVTTAVSSKSTSLVVPQHQTTLKFPLWKEPKPHHCSNGVLKKNNKANRSISREDQYERSESRNNAQTNENTGLMVIDATCEVIRVEFIVLPEKCVISRPTDSSKQRSDSNHDHKTTEPAIDRSSVCRLITQTSHTSSKVQPKHETLKERAERILGVVLQNSFNEAQTLEEISQMEDSSIQQIHDTSEGSAEAESELWLKAECENAQIPKTSTPNEEETPSSMPEAEDMLEISEMTQEDAMNALTEIEIMEMMSMKQKNEHKTVDRKWFLMLEEKIPTPVIDIKENQVEDSCDDRPSGDTEDVQNLNQTILRNTSETFSQKPKRREDNLLHETDETQNLNQTLGGRCVENANDPFSQEDTPTEGNSSNVRGAHVEIISDLLAETGDIQNPSSILPNSYEPDTNKVFDREHRPTEQNPFIAIHCLQRTSEMFCLEEGHHQENLLNPQNLCSDLLSTSEALYQESSPKQNQSYSGDPHVCPPFRGHHVETTDESFAHEVFSRDEHLSDVWPNLLDRTALNISDTLVQEDILREDRPSHAKHDANNICQTLPGKKMENRSRSCDHEDALSEGNISGDVIIHHPLFSVKVIQEPFDDQSRLGEDGAETLSSLLQDQCVYSLHEGKLPETTNMKNFSPNTFGNIEETSESFKHEASSEKKLLLDDLQNLCPILFSGSVQNSHDLFEREDNEIVRSPSPDLHMLSKEELTSSLLYTFNSEISPRPPDCVSSTCPPPLEPAACSSHSRPSDSLCDITRIHAKVCSSASSTARGYIRANHCPQSLWDAVGRIRRHTAPDSETEDEDGEYWESVENTEDGIQEELEERSGSTRNNGQEVTEEKVRHFGERNDDDDDDDSLSSSSVDSQDTVIEGEDKQNVLQNDEEKTSDLFTEKEE